MDDNVDSCKSAKSCSEPEDPEYSGSLDEGEDDEATLEEEESQENSSDVADEIDELQKEGDMPIEELLKMYSCGQNAFAANYQHPTAVEDQYGSAGTSGSEEEILSSGDLTLDKRAISAELLGDENRPTSADELISSVGTPGSGVNLTTHQSGNSDSNLYRYLVGDVNEYNEDDEESDEDFVPDESRRKEIQVGPEYQAEIPEFESDPNAGNSADSQTSNDLEELVFRTDDETLVEEFLCKCREIYAEIHRVDTGESLIKRPIEDEKALQLLFKNQFHTETAAAIYRDELQKQSEDQLRLWSDEDCRLFEEGLLQHGKIFHVIRATHLPHRKISELITFYYNWKKTARHDVLMKDNNRLEKRVYGERHPYIRGFSDPMERIADDYEVLGQEKLSTAAADYFPIPSKTHEGHSDGMEVRLVGGPNGVVPSSPLSADAAVHQQPDYQFQHHLMNSMHHKPIDQYRSQQLLGSVADGNVHRNSTGASVMEETEEREAKRLAEFVELLPTGKKIKFSPTVDVSTDSLAE